MQKHPHLLVLYCHQFVCRVTFRWLIYGCEQGVARLTFSARHLTASIRSAALCCLAAQTQRAAPRSTGHCGSRPEPIPQPPHGHVPGSADEASLQLPGSCSIALPTIGEMQSDDACKRGVPSLSCEFGSPELILMARYCQRPEGLRRCAALPSLRECGGGMVLEENPYWDMVLNIVLFGLAFWLCLTHPWTLLLVLLPLPTTKTNQIVVLERAGLGQLRHRQLQRRRLPP